MDDTFLFSQTLKLGQVFSCSCLLLTSHTVLGISRLISRICLATTRKMTVSYIDIFAGLQASVSWIYDAGLDYLCSPMPSHVNRFNVQLSVVPPLPRLSVCASRLPSLPSLLPHALCQCCSFLLDFLLGSFLHLSLALKTVPIKHLFSPPSSFSSFFFFSSQHHMVV